MDHAQPSCTEDHYETVRANCAELTWGELNMSIMGQLMALTYCQPTTINSTRHRHNPKKRERNTTAFQHHGRRKTFLVLHGIGEYRLKAIKARYISAFTRAWTQGSYRSKHFAS